MTNEPSDHLRNCCYKLLQARSTRAKQSEARVEIEAREHVANLSALAEDFSGAYFRRISRSVMPDLPISDVVSFSSEDPVKSIHKTAAEPPGDNVTFRRPTAPRISSKRTPFANGIARRPKKSKHPSYSRQNAFLSKETLS